MLRHASVSVETAFVKRYFSSFLLLLKLSKCERVLLDFITEEMDENNMVVNSKLLRDKFNLLLDKMRQDTYSDSTIHKCFSSLTNHNLLIKQKGRGLFQVSPLFFFKGSEEDREKLIRKNLEEINRIQVNDYRRSALLYSKFSAVHENQTPPQES